MPAIRPAPFLRLAAFALVVGACATIPRESSERRATPASPYLLTAAEISRVQVISAYEAVERLKPNFLLGLRGNSDPVKRAVYLNGSRLLGGVENLRNIEASSVRQILFLNGMEATNRYGSGNGAGVLLVSTLAPPR